MNEESVDAVADRDSKNTRIRALAEAVEKTLLAYQHKDFYEQSFKVLEALKRKGVNLSGK